MAPQRSPSKGSSTGSPSSRATQLLAKARAAAAATPAGSATAAHAASQSNQKLPGFSGLPDDISAKSDAPRSSGTQIKTVPLPQLLKQMTSHGLTMQEAIPIVGQLVKGGFAVPEKLSLLSHAALQELGIESVEMQKKVIGAFAGKRTAMMLKAANAGSDSERPKKRRRRADDDETLSREWGNVAGPSTSSKSSGTIDYRFNETLDESELRGRYVFVNRAPVMTAWATVVLERLGFNRAEALSVAHCYVAHTATARGVSIGVLPASARDKAVNIVGPNQPHFELMGVKIPVMQVEGEQWRGISGGECIGPEKAFNYVRKSMFQTLPLVMGALTLLADSFMAPSTSAEAQLTSSPGMGEGVKPDPEDPEPGSEVSRPHGSDHLHAKAYALYSQFRPETGGEWGKRARFELDKILALRQGHEEEWAEWLTKEERVDEDPDADAETAVKQEGSPTIGEEEEELRRDIEKFIDEAERLDAEQHHAGQVGSTHDEENDEEDQASSIDAAIKREVD